MGPPWLNNENKTLNGGARAKQAGCRPKNCKFADLQKRFQSKTERKTYETFKIVEEIRFWTQIKELEMKLSIYIYYITSMISVVTDALHNFLDKSTL